MCSHDVSIVLPGPGWRAAGLGWDRDYSWSSRHVAHSTGDITSIGCYYRAIILCSPEKDISLRYTPVCDVGAILRCSGQTQVVGSTSLFTGPM